MDMGTVRVLGPSLSHLLCFSKIKSTPTVLSRQGLPPCLPTSGFSPGTGDKNYCPHWCPGFIGPLGLSVPIRVMGTTLPLPPASSSKEERRNQLPPAVVIRECVQTSPGSILLTHLLWLPITFTSILHTD